MAETSLYSTFGAVTLFIVALACLPWLLRRWMQQRAAQSGQLHAGLKVAGAVAVGPHQRVVVVEVGPEGRRTTLVLGVTAQQVTCLHAMDASGQPLATPLAPEPVFAQVLSAQQRDASLASSKDISHGD